jgi:hypothetical protein
MRNPTEEQIDDDIEWIKRESTFNVSGVQLFRFIYRSVSLKRTKVGKFANSPERAFMLLKDLVAKELEMYP